MPITQKAHVIETDADELQEREHFVGRKSNAIPVKELAAFRNSLRAKKRRLNAGEEDSDDEAAYRGLGKRKRSVGDAKVRSLHAQGTDSSQRQQAEDLTSLPLNLVVRVNYERFYVQWRTQLVIAVVRDRHGHLLFFYPDVSAMMASTRTRRDRARRPGFLLDSGQARSPRALPGARR